MPEADWTIANPICSLLVNTKHNNRASTIWPRLVVLHYPTSFVSTTIVWQKCHKKRLLKEVKFMRKTKNNPNVTNDAPYSEKQKVVSAICKILKLLLKVTIKTIFLIVRLVLLFYKLREWFE
jgi:hypothetical protein